MGHELATIGFVFINAYIIYIEIHGSTPILVCTLLAK